MSLFDWSDDRAIMSATRPLALVWPEERVTDQLVKRVNFAFALGNQRTPGQDIEFARSQPACRNRDTSPFPRGE